MQLEPPKYYDPEDLCGEEWELNNEEIAALDLQGAASPMEVEGELPDMNAKEMAQEGFLRRLKLHGQNHTKCTQLRPCKKIVFHRLCFLKTEY